MYVGANEIAGYKYLTTRLFNPEHQTRLSVSESGERAAVVHPSGRALFQLVSQDVQCGGQVCLKKAKMGYPGVTFTGGSPSEASYVLDVFGVRPTQLEEGTIM